jgi:hypothetical protein
VNTGGSYPRKFGKYDLILSSDISITVNRVVTLQSRTIATAVIVGG